MAGFRVEHLMEKERLFREMYVQHKSSHSADGNTRQQCSTSSGKALAEMRNGPQVDIENRPSPSVTM